MMGTRTIALGFGLAALAGSAAVAEPRVSARHSDWTVYVDDTSDGLVCYAMTEAVDMAPANLNHGQVVIMVATWRSGQAREQVMFHTGYTLRLEGPTRARVGSDTYGMFADGSDAFARDEDESGLVRAMRRGSTLRVEAMSERGNATAYEFSLRGVTAALRGVDQAC